MQLPKLEKFIFLIDHSIPREPLPSSPLEHRRAWVLVFSINAHSTPRYVPSGLLALSPLTVAREEAECEEGLRAQLEDGGARDGAGLAFRAIHDRERHLAPFGYPIFDLFGFFLTGTVFFSHNNLARIVFSASFS